MKDNSLSKRNIILNLSVLFVVTALVIFYLFKNNFLTKDAISKIYWYNYLIVLFVFFFGLSLVALVDFFVYRSFTSSMPYGRCMLNTVCGNLGSGITPFKSGHFPLMLYYQNRAGVPISDSITGLVKCQIIYSATSIVVYACVVSALMILGTSITFYGVTVELWLVVSLGLIFHVAVFIAIVVLAFNGKIQDFALTIWSKLLFKLKKIEDTAQYKAEKIERLNLYKQQLSIIGKNFYKYIAPSLIYVVFMLVSCGIQYLSYLLVSNNYFTANGFFTFYTFYLASGYITNIIPVPGGLGTSELLFPLVFASIIPESEIGAVLILWRLASYYFAIIIEFIIFLFAVLRRKKPKTHLKPE